MKRRLFNLAAATSLLLCLACLGMWVRSGFVWDIFEKEHGGDNSTTFISAGGNLSLMLFRYNPPLMGNAFRSRPWRGQRDGPARTSEAQWVWQSPQYERRVNPLPKGIINTTARLTLPYWLLTLISGILPTLWFWQRRKEKKAARRRGFEVLPAAMFAPSEGQKRD